MAWPAAHAAACASALNPWRALAAGALPPELAFDAVSTWWNGDHEIDVVAMDGGATTLVGSCKWTNAPVGLAELRALRAAALAGTGELQPAEGCWFALFARQGFTPEVAALAGSLVERLLLFTPPAMFL